MLYPESEIRWLDISTEKYYKGSIDDLFIKYADRVHRLSKDTSVIAFGAEKGPKLKIQDWTGWTDLQTVWKIPANDDKWCKLSSKADLNINITVSQHELVPAYDISDTKIGFHGEVKYGYFLKHPVRMISSDMMRVRGIDDLYPDHPQFTPVSMEELDIEREYGYHIYTVSQFLTVNNFHIYGSDFVDINIISGQIRGYK